MPKHCQIMPKSCPNHAQIIPKTFLKHSQIIPKTCPNHSQIIPKSCPNHVQIILCMYHMCIMCAYMYITGICHWHVSYVDIIWRCDMEISYVDIMWRIIWWCDKQKFHGFGSPPGGIFEKKTTCKTKDVTFWRSLVIQFWYRIQNLRKKTGYIGIKDIF